MGHHFNSADVLNIKSIPDGFSTVTTRKLHGTKELFKTWKSGFLPGFNTTEKVLKRLIKASDSLLKRRYIGSILKFGDMGLNLVYDRWGRFSLLVRINLFLTTKVVEFAVFAHLPEKFTPLRLGRVKTKFDDGFHLPFWFSIYILTTDSETLPTVPT